MKYRWITIRMGFFFRIERISSNCAEENRKIKREMTGHSKGHCLVCLPNSSFPNSLCKLFTRKYSELILIEKLSSSEKSIIAIPIRPLQITDHDKTGAKYFLNWSDIRPKVSIRIVFISFCNSKYWFSTPLKSGAQTIWYHIIFPNFT